MATATLRAVLEGFDQAVRQLDQVASGQDKVAQGNSKVADSANDATRPLKDLQLASEGVGGSMSGALTLGATAASAAVVAFGAKVFEETKKLADLGDEVNRLAQTTGIGAAQLTSYTLAFETN